MKFMYADNYDDMHYPGFGQTTLLQMLLGT